MISTPNLARTYPSEVERITNLTNPLNRISQNNIHTRFDLIIKEEV